jgi:4-hydroxythreonine-4-phosphate dehydrogenase
MPHLALTIGDPTGIGPEITVKTLQRLGEFADLELTVIGSLKTLEKAAADLNLSLPNNNAITYQSVEADLPGSVAYQSLDAAVKLIADKKAQALVTGPISKRNLHAADYKFHGHTEILEEMAQRYFDAKDARAEMLFVYKNFRLMLLTRHVALKDVPAAIAKQGAVAKPLKTLISFLRKQLDISDPHIAILGVNPHIGEVGGDEEEKYITPVIKAVNAIGASTLAGPLAADGFFRGFTVQDNPYDAIVAMYHDQGLIPFKLLAGYEAVNVTIGLPFIRTSVSHGTAEDIVGKGTASEASLIAALHAALETL